MSIRRANGLYIFSTELERSLWDIDYSAGAPSRPNLTIDTAGQLSWTAATGSAGETLGYGISVFPEGPSITISGTSAIVSNYSVGNTYTFTVWGVNVAGRGVPSIAKSVTIGYNAASGGVETTVADYNGTGETWKVHEFTSNGTLSITSAFQPFNFLLVGGGGYGGGGSPDNGATSRGGGGGGSGEVDYRTDQILSTGSYPIVVGTERNNSTFNSITALAGGSGSSCTGGSNTGNGFSGGSCGGDPHHKGGGGGAGSNGNGGNAGFGGAGGGAATSNNITGSSVSYAGGGNGGNSIISGGGNGNTGIGLGAGGRGGGSQGSAGAGRSGYFAIAYRIS